MRRSTPEEYINILHKLKIDHVLCLSQEPEYDFSIFKSGGIALTHLPMDDQTCPEEEDINKFLDVCSNENGPLAVHCDSGLGLTGTLIGIYAMKYYQIPATVYIAWARICRPGSIIGGQQNFLVDKEEKYIKEGKIQGLLKGYEPKVEQLAQELLAKVKNERENKERIAKIKMRF